MEDWDKDILKNAHTPIENVVDTLDAKIVYLNLNYVLSGVVFISLV